MNLIVDNDSGLGYETNSFGRKCLNFFLIPILNGIPANFRKAIKKSHESAEEVINHATTHRALEVLYNHGHPHRSRHWLKRFFHYIWFHTNNSKAVRNRLRLVKREIKNHIEYLLGHDKPVSILSIASGSARAIVEAISGIKLPAGRMLAVTFLDKNPKALEYSRTLVENLHGVSCKWIENTVGGFFRVKNENERFDIIEMVGLMDYFNDEKATTVFSSIFNSLSPGGILITANIVDNPERKFVTKAVGWNMIYRSAEELSELIAKAGFEKDKMRKFYEPLKVHTVIVAAK